MKKSPLALAVIPALVLAASNLVQAAQSQQADGFIEGSTLKLLNRNFYFNRN